MKRDTTGRLAAFFAAMLKPLAALSLILLVPALSACTTSEGTNAMVDPGTFEREVMDPTLQGLDILPPPAAKDDKERRGPLVMPKQMAQLPAPQKGGAGAALPVDSDNPQINTAGLSDADLQHLRNARVIDLQALDGRPLTDTERKQLTARLAAANVGQVPGTRALTLPPVSYFSDYKGKDAVCKAADGTLVPFRDSRCPVKIRNAMVKNMAPTQGVDQSISNDLYNASNGLTSNDQGYR
jgi:hypothetical protein